MSIEVETAYLENIGVLEPSLADYVLCIDKNSKISVDTCNSQRPS